MFDIKTQDNIIININDAINFVSMIVLDKDSYNYLLSLKLKLESEEYAHLINRDDLINAINSKLLTYNTITNEEVVNSLKENKNDEMKNLYLIKLDNNNELLILRVIDDLRILLLKDKYILKNIIDGNEDKISNMDEKQIYDFFSTFIDNKIVFLNSDDIADSNDEVFNFKDYMEKFGLEGELLVTSINDELLFKISDGLYKTGNNFDIITLVKPSPKDILDNKPKKLSKTYTNNGMINIVIIIEIVIIMLLTIIFTFTK